MSRAIFCLVMSGIVKPIFLAKKTWSVVDAVLCGPTRIAILGVRLLFWETDLDEATAFDRISSLLFLSLMMVAKKTIWKITNIAAPQMPRHFVDGFRNAVRRLRRGYGLDCVFGSMVSISQS